MRRDLGAAVHRVQRGLSARERAIASLEAVWAGRRIDPALQRPVHAGDAAEYERLLGISARVSRALALQLVSVTSAVEVLRVRAEELTSLERWNGERLRVSATFGAIAAHADTFAASRLVFDTIRQAIVEAGEEPADFLSGAFAWGSVEPWLPLPAAWSAREPIPQASPEAEFARAKAWAFAAVSTRRRVNC